MASDPNQRSASTDLAVARVPQIRDRRSIERLRVVNRNVRIERIDPMKNTHNSNSVSSIADVGAAAVARYQVYRQTHTGTYTAEFTTDSAADAVQAFLKQSPAFEGGELRLWDRVEERVGASVEWRKEKTDFGFPVLNRANVFHDRVLEVIARQMEVREEIRREIQHGVQMSA